MLALTIRGGGWRSAVFGLCALLFNLHRGPAQSTVAPGRPSYQTTAQTGRMVISPQFESVGSFSDGLAAVLVGEGDRGKWGFIDKSGRMVIAPQFAKVGQFS